MPVTEVALAMALEAPLVREAYSELRLEAAEPVAVARDEASADDREAMSELTEEDLEETAEEMDDETLARDEETALLAEEASEAAEDVTEDRELEIALEMEAPVSWVVVVVSWAW